MKANRVFLVRASWRATKKLLHITAHHEEDAIKRATRMKENTGAMELVVIKEITTR